MALTTFAFCRALSEAVPVDADFKTFVITDPSNMPRYQQIGTMRLGPDGTPLFVGVPEISIEFYEIRLNTDLQGNAITAGTIKELYTEYYANRGLMYFNLLSPVTGDYYKTSGRLKWPDPSDKINGKSIRGLILEIRGIGVDYWNWNGVTGQAYSGGEPNPVALSKETSFDPYWGSYGYGQYGNGAWGSSALTAITWS